MRTDFTSGQLSEQCWLALWHAKTEKVHIRKYYFHNVMSQKGRGGIEKVERVATVNFLSRLPGVGWVNLIIMLKFDTS